MDERIIFEQSIGDESTSSTKIFTRLEKDIPASPFNIRYLQKLSKSETEKEAQKGILNDLTIEILSF